MTSSYPILLTRIRSASDPNQTPTPTAVFAEDPAGDPAMESRLRDPMAGCSRAYPALVGVSEAPQPQLARNLRIPPPAQPLPHGAGSRRIPPDPTGSHRIPPDPAGSHRIPPDPAGSRPSQDRRPAALAFPAAPAAAAGRSRSQLPLPPERRPVVGPDRLGRPAGGAAKRARSKHGHVMAARFAPPPHRLASPPLAWLPRDADRLGFARSPPVGLIREFSL